MNFRFSISLTQRSRSITHLVDPIIERGHSLYIVKNTDKFNPKSFYTNPWKVNDLNPEWLKYIADNFGITMKHADKIKWITKKEKIKAVNISLDTLNLKNGKTSHGTVNIPYNEYKTYSSEGDFEVGNFLCEAIKNSQQNTPEKNQVLIVHSGGGRGIVSPLYEQLNKEQVIKNNIKLLQSVLDKIPIHIEKVVVKTHPAPYQGCDYKSMIKYVLPNLSSKITVENNNLVQLICESKYVINFGSSTVLWLLGSEKRWINIIDCAQYNLEHPRRRDKIERAENWDEWKQNIKLNDLHDMICYYDEKISDQPSIISKYKSLFNYQTTEMVLNILEKEHLNV